jgi:hypothetical protein
VELLRHYKTVRQDNDKVRKLGMVCKGNLWDSRNLFSFGMVDNRNNDNIKRWNVLSLKEYFDLAITNLDDKIEQRFRLMQEAVNKAEYAHEKRLEGMNEFRSQLKDQQLTFIERTQFNTEVRNLTEKISDLKREVDKAKNIKEGGSIVWAYVIAGISLIMGIISVTINLTR